MVERKHRHILKIARALRFQANLPIGFWGECVLTAIYIINRLPSRVIENKTPYEILFNKKPTYEQLRVFGCLVYARDNKTGGDKFEDRGRAGVFVGYPHGQKGYRVYDLLEKKIVTSRDVKFVENNYPFKLVQLDGSSSKITDELTADYGKDEEVESSQTSQATSTSSNAPNELHEDVDTDLDHNNVRETPNNVVEVVVDGLGRQDLGGRKERIKTQPKRLGDYVTDLPPSIDHSRPTATSGSSTVHSISHFVSYANFSASLKAFLSAITARDEPKNFHHA